MSDLCKTPRETEETVELIAPFLPRAIVNELCSGRMHADYRERKLDLQRILVGQAIDYQKRVIAPMLARSKPRELGGFRWVGTFADHLAASARGKYGRNCFSDPDFLKHTLKHTPEARAPKPECPFIVVPGLRDDPDFQKSRRLEGSDSPSTSDRNTGAANVGRSDYRSPHEGLHGRSCPGGSTAFVRS